MDLTKLENLTQEVADELFGDLGLNGVVSWKIDSSVDDEIPTIRVDITGDDIGYLIGPKGKFLDALQHIISLIVSKKAREINDSNYTFYIHLDVNGYKKESIARLEKLAMQKADDARIIGEPIDLDPMPARERSIINMALQKFDDITTESFGEGRDRHVRIIPKTEEELGVIKSEEELENEANDIEE